MLAFNLSNLLFTIKLFHLFGKLGELFFWKFGKMFKVIKKLCAAFISTKFCAFDIVACDYARNYCNDKNWTYGKKDWKHSADKRCCKHISEAYCCCNAEAVPYAVKKPSYVRFKNPYCNTHRKKHDNITAQKLNCARPFEDNFQQFCLFQSTTPSKINYSNLNNLRQGNNYAAFKTKLLKVKFAFASGIWLCQVKSSSRTVKLPYRAVVVEKIVCKIKNKVSRPIWFALQINRCIHWMTYRIKIKPTCCSNKSVLLLKYKMKWKIKIND